MKKAFLFLALPFLVGCSGISIQIGPTPTPVPTATPAPTSTPQPSPTPARQTEDALCAKAVFYIANTTRPSDSDVTGIIDLVWNRDFAPGTIGAYLHQCLVEDWDWSEAQQGGKYWGGNGVPGSSG